MNGSALKSSLSVLRAHAARISRRSMREIFELDPDRFRRFSLRWGDLHFDHSRQLIDGPALESLISIAAASGIEHQRDRMFSGAIVNATEGRAALHTALRDPSNEPLMVGDTDIRGEIARVRREMIRFANAVRSGRHALAGGRVTDVVNIGIGGSGLGPQMSVRALSPYHKGPRCHFVSNVDGADITDTLAGLDPQTTLFVIASKTFTTSETMRNAETARKWVRRAVGAGQAGRHFAALSTNLEATRAFGIGEERTFGFWDWVGGRYSIWSAIGLTLMIAIGPRHFEAFLAGAHEADRHFREAPLAANIPVLMALLGIWNRNVLGHQSLAVLPYDHRLARLPAYLQQLEMESNGKSVTVTGRPVKSDTAPVIWGEPGTDGQHAFFQMLHQGTQIIPCDFLVAANPHEKTRDHHDMLLANCLAQAEALMRGRTLNEARTRMEAAGLSPREVKYLAPHRVFEGNRPSSMLLYKKLDPAMLGRLLALYEHKVFVQGVIWGINSFDQWGVELGKQMANDLVLMVRGEKPARGADKTTSGMLGVLAEFRK